MRRGPLAVLLLLAGLLLGSAGGVSVGLETEGSRSQLQQTRTAKGAVALRTATRETAAEDDSNDPLVVPPRPTPVSHGADAYPAARAGTSEAAAPPRPILLGYQARAPPAA